MTKWTQIVQRVDMINSMFALRMEFPSYDAKIDAELKELSIDLEDFIVNRNRQVTL